MADQCCKETPFVPLVNVQHCNHRVKWVILLKYYIGGEDDRSAVTGPKVERVCPNCGIVDTVVIGRVEECASYLERFEL